MTISLDEEGGALSLDIFVSFLLSWFSWISGEANISEVHVQASDLIVTWGAVAL